MLTAFSALVRKDLRLFFSDRRALMMGLVAPIAIASFFGYIFGGNGERAEISRISVLLADQDGGAISRDLAARMSADKALEVKPASPEKAREEIRKGKAAVAVLIPPKFGEDAGGAFFNAAAKPEIGVLFDPTHTMEASVVQGILAGHVMESVSKEMFSGEGGRRAVKEALAEIGRSSDMPSDERESLLGLLRGVEGWNTRYRSGTSGRESLNGGLTLPYTARSEAVTSGSGVLYNGYAHSFGGMGIQFILMVGIEQGIIVLLQRQRGVWKRLRAAPLARGVLLGSRATSAAVTSMFILLAMFAFARIVFGVRIEGSLAGFLGVCAAFSLMTAAFGLLIAALGKTPEATRGLAILVTLLMVMLGGAWVPTFVFPQWLQRLTVIVPTRWAMDGLDAVTWRGLGYSDAVWPITMLTACALAFAAIAAMRFRWEAD